jgi:hypothetical protein
MNNQGNIRSVAELKGAIRVLESEQELKGRLLKEHALVVYERLKPVNLIRDIIKDLFSSSYPVDDISGTAAGMTGGYLLKKLFVGRSSGVFRNLLGYVLQYVSTNYLARNSAMIKAVALSVFDMIFRKKKAD